MKKLIIATLVLLGAFFHSAKAQVATDEIVTAGFFETISNQVENLQLMIETAEEIANGNELFRQVYSASRFLTTSPRVSELVNELRDYYDMSENLLAEAKMLASDSDYSSSWEAERRLYRSTRIMLNSGKIIENDFKRIKRALTEDGYTFTDRDNMVKEMIDELVSNKGLLAQEFASLKNIKFKKKKNDLDAETNDLTNTILTGESETTGKGANSKSSEDKIYLSEEQEKEGKEVLDAANSYGKERDKMTLDNIERQRDDLIGKAFDWASILAGIVALGALPILFARRYRGEKQTADSFYKFFIGIAFFIIALQIVKIIVS